ncbi:MAG TPA: ParB/RepB/Spo0J family partition protein [Myxococcota bacterium]|nr:ParB/RepB/Spo0J family partition protein [Myxococcota bacterium]
MTTTRNALGRGIGALIPGARPASQPTPLHDHDARFERAGEIPVADIDPNPDQPRRSFEPGALDALSESIRVHGVLQPIVVRRAGDRYELVVGERRWRASKQAGLASIPAVVLEIDPRDRLEVALVENVQRRDLNPIELAVAFRALADTGATQEEIGQRVGMDRSSIANHLRLLELPRELQADVEAGRVTIGHAKALLSVASPERRRALRDRIVGEQLSVRAAEEIARPTPRTPAVAERVRGPQDPHLQGVADALRQRLQTRVRVKGSAERGRVEIEYFGAEDFDRITGVLLRDG